MTLPAAYEVTDSTFIDDDAHLAAQQALLDAYDPDRDEWDGEGDYSPAGSTARRPVPATDHIF